VSVVDDNETHFMLCNGLCVVTVFDIIIRGVNAAVFVTLCVHAIRTLNHEQVPFWFVTFYWSFDHFIMVVLEVPRLKDHCCIWLRITERINNVVLDVFRDIERLTFQMGRSY